MIFFFLILAYCIIIMVLITKDSLEITKSQVEENIFTQMGVFIKDFLKMTWEMGKEFYLPWMVVKLKEHGSIISKKAHLKFIKKTDSYKVCFTSTGRQYVDLRVKIPL